jgi:hypothetical protein
MNKVDRVLCASLFIVYAVVSSIIEYHTILLIFFDVSPSHHLHKSKFIALTIFPMHPFLR